jgi:uncharacterized membrane protein
MLKTRVETFSDNVIAIIMTIMVIDLKMPQGVNFSDLFPLSSIFMGYVLSFLYLAIYWNNHHHLFQAVREVNGITLWANIHLLLWLSFIPFVTAWAGANDFAAVPTAVYGAILFMTGFAYWLLTKVLIAQHENRFILVEALGKDYKTLFSIALYGVAIPLCIWYPFIAFLMYIFNALLWIVPDARIEKRLKS